MSRSHLALNQEFDRLASRQSEEAVRVVLRTSDGERRAHARRAVSDLPWLKYVRLKYGPAVSLIDLSASGAQVETAVTLRPGATIVVEIDGIGTEFAVPSQVLRCHVSAIAPHTTYRGALAFRRALDLPQIWETSGAIANPKHEHARLAHALKRHGHRFASGSDLVSASANGENGMQGVGEAALAAAAMMIEMPAARRAGPAFVQELSNLFREVTRGIEQGDSPNALLDRLGQRLRRVVPARAIRVTEALEPEQLRGTEAVYFEVPSGPDRSAAKLVVEFPRDCAPDEWQFQLLKASAHLVTLIRELDNGARQIVPPASHDLQASSPASAYTKVVVRYADGRLLKGYTADFSASRGHFHLLGSLDAPVDARVAVPFGHVKAVFFVRDFDGESGYVERKTFDHPTSGRKMAITFLDDELLVGTTLNYQPDGQGFFVFPADPKGNNLRVFVVSRAVRHVQFL